MECHRRILRHRQESLKARSVTGKGKRLIPSADKILKICEVLHVTPYELLSERDMTADEGSDYLAALNNDEGIVLETFRNLQTKQKERLLGYLEALKDIK